MNSPKTSPALAEGPLGKKSAYVSTYTPGLLFPIPRQPKRAEIGIGETLPFKGVDIWNGYELSWLSPKGKPVAALAEFRVPCESPSLIESKSFKLYLNSFSGSKFESAEAVKEAMEIDLATCAGAAVSVKIVGLDEEPKQLGALSGTCLDGLDVECTRYLPETSYLSAVGAEIEETLHTNLLKSNCPVTGQPDWGSIEIAYRGKKIFHSGLLKYLISLRDHDEFHEQCVERVFTDIQTHCRPKMLTVYARYTRRGGLDINPYRTSRHNPAYDPRKVSNQRLVRQ